MASLDPSPAPAILSDADQSRVSLEIREAQPADRAGLAELERVAGEEVRIGPWKFGFSTTSLGPFFASARHYQRWHSLVAVDRRQNRLAGLVCYGIENVQLNGAIRPGAQLFNWRVHPDWRYHDLGPTLIHRAINGRREADGATVVWTAQVGDNPSSLGPTRRSRPLASRRLAGRIARPTRRAPALPGKWRIRRAAIDDATAIATLQNTFYADHQLWVPRDIGLPAEKLADSLAGDDGEVYLVEDYRGRPRASATIRYLGRSRELRVVKLPLAVRLAHRLSSWLPNQLRWELDWHQPLRVAVIVDLAFPPGANTAATALLHWLSWAAGRESDLVAISIDQVSVEWSVLRQFRGWPFHLTLVADSPETLDAARPWYYALS